MAIGRALIKRPRFCFADEPTSALDWGSGQVVIDQLQKAAHEYESTIIVVSHDQRLLEHVDVSYHLDDGRLTETDIPANRGSGTVEDRNMNRKRSRDGRGLARAGRAGFDGPHGRPRARRQVARLARQAGERRARSSFASGTRTSRIASSRFTRTTSRSRPR